jgi:hypothetical protein
MMPAALVYALSGDRQRAALNAAKATRTADRTALRHDEVPAPTRTFARRGLRRLRRARECTS